MEHVHALKNLAPRDIVAREIDKMIKKHGLRAVHLDLTHLAPDYALLAGGIDMTKEPIPVVPAAHYFCGGVKVDQEGCTGIDGLLAAGEVTSTGLHGANRLASNSLLEGAIYGTRAAAAMVKHRDAVKGSPLAVQIEQWDAGTAKHPDELVVLTHTWDEIRKLMWNYVGIVRTDRRRGCAGAGVGRCPALERALARLDFLRAEIQKYYWDHILTRDLVELRNVVTVAELVVRSALARRESRGCSFNLDCPDRDDDNWLHRNTDLRRDWTKYY